MSGLAIDGHPPVRERGSFLVFGAPQIEEAEIEEVVACMRRRWLGSGPKVLEFERAFATYKDSPYAVALHSCTAALHLSLLAHEIGPGDEVITTPMTFAATVNAIIHTGARPVLADCDRTTQNINPDEIARRITPRTKAILVVHFAGLCCDMEPILELARSRSLLVIEDCAHAIESEYRGRKAGTMGDAGCFSFYVTKNVVSGEGGMVVTRDEQVQATVRVLGLHGLSRDAWKRFSDQGYRHYEVVRPGFKYNMMDLQAVIGIAQLRRVEANWLRRRSIWRTYQREFADLPCMLPTDDGGPGGRHAHHLYTPLLDLEALGRSRDWVLSALTAENIGVGVHYLPVHHHPYYQQRFGWRHGNFPNAEWIGERTLSLPLSAALNDQDVADVCQAFRKVLRAPRAAH